MEDFWDCWIAKNSGNKMPDGSLNLRSWPITSVCFALVIEGNNQRKVRRRCESDTGDPLGSCFNVDRQDATSIRRDVSDKGSHVGECGLDPDLTFGSPKVGVGGLTLGFCRSAMAVGRREY